jgi:hypothetical protein
MLHIRCSNRGYYISCMHRLRNILIVICSLNAAAWVLTRAPWRRTLTDFFSIVFSHQSSWTILITLLMCFCFLCSHGMTWGSAGTDRFRCLPDEQVCRHNAEAPDYLNIVDFCARVRSERARSRHRKIESQDRDTATDTARSRELTIHSMSCKDCETQQ